MSTVETPTSHAQAAAAIAEQLRTLITTSINGFTFLTAAQRRRLNAAASVPDKFLLEVAQALDDSPEFAAAAKVLPADLRDAVLFAQAYAPLATMLQLYARGVLDTIARHRAVAGEAALRAYGVAKSFDRQSQIALPVPQVRNMKNALGRGRRGRTAPPENQQPPEVK